MTDPVTDTLPGIPKDDDGPVFDEPWQAEAFALTVTLHQQGAFSWNEWADALGHERAKAPADDDGSGYYLDWLAALEKLVAKKGIVDTATLLARKQVWAKAALSTLHGQPILLENAE